MSKTIALAPDCLKGMALSSYFFFDAVVGRYIPGLTSLGAFSEYADVFCINDAPWLERIYRVISSELFSAASSTASFNMLSRASIFYPDRFTEDEKYVILEKRAAMRARCDIFGENTEFTCDKTLLLLEEAAEAGNAHASALLAFIEQNGILVKADPAAAREHIERLAAWNSTPGALMGLKYCPAERRTYFASILTATLASATTSDTLAHVCRRYGLRGPVAPSELAAALESAFAKQVVRRDTIEANRLKIISSPILSEESKKKLLSLEVKDDALAAIPLGVKRDTAFTPVFRLVGSSPLVRAEEREAIVKNLALIDLRHSLNYKPLLLICEDRFVLEEYARLIATTFSERAVGCIDASDPGQSLSSHGAENAFLGVLDRLGDASSVVMIENCDELDDYKSEELAKLLDIDCRRNFRMTLGAVSVDLSGMLPILFATHPPHRSIIEACDTVHLDALCKEEFRPVVESIIAKKERTFGLESLTISADGLEAIEDLSVYEIEELLDKTIALLREKSRRINLTAGSFEIDSDDGDGDTLFGRGRTNDFKKRV